MQAVILVSHILIALTSLALTTLVYLRPSRAGIKSAYGLVGLTLASGFYLTWMTPGHLLQSCLTGLVYLGLVMTGVVASHHKLRQSGAGDE
jgi:hypothetical protein